MDLAWPGFKLVLSRPLATRGSLAKVGSLASAHCLCPSMPLQCPRLWDVRGRGTPLRVRFPVGVELVGKEPQWLVCSVAEAAAESSLEGGNMALAIFIPVLLISLLLGGAYIYVTR